MTAESPAIFLQSESHPAEDVRRFIAAVSNDAEGVVGSDDLEVSERSGGPNMSVDVAGGRCFVLGDEDTYQGSYFCENRGATNLVVSAADATNDRIDLVVAQVEDSEYSGASDAWSLAVVTGTPAASPAEPSVPDNAIVLARIDVAALAASITNSDITDRRSLHNPHFAIETFSTSGSFTKADYPWAKSVRVRLLGGGGGSGGCAATSGSERCESAGGGGGGYSEKRILVGALSASETVTVGTGGAAGAAGNSGGGTGGTSSFGSHCSATGGNGGAGAAATSTQGTSGRGYRGAGSGGDINVPGGHGGNGITAVTGSSIYQSMQNFGGASYMAGPVLAIAGFSSAAVAGEGPGCGAGGGRNTNSAAARAGAAGGDGIVIVEIYG